MARIRANGIDMAYESYGSKDGVPILLIHGFGQQLTAWPEEFRDGLVNAGLRVLCFDNRDVGLTQKWDGMIPDVRAIMAALRDGQKPDIPYFLSDMAADAAGLLDALQIGSAHICGASMGGMIAQLVALEHPQKARSLVAIFSTTNDMGLPPSTPEAHMALTTRSEAQDRASVIDHILKSRRAYASTAFAVDDERGAAQIGRSFDRCYYPEGLLRHWAAILAGPPRGTRLKGLKLPALVMHGSADTLLPPEHGRQLAACIPGAEFHEIEGWGHDLPLGVIPLLHGFMLPFVERVEASRK
ncbi:MAG: alpha/beta hydrolase [Alphaproteobacteria bacterium]|nr:alpha/beta hydrolase [Alphaproteobacteria bacterium]MDE1986365.1 alpha/beta hydrolase [Alphaproteobacteria bacterium]MDE2164012.1 alpha/beta hydrolase [Alphaproteobacteria bacterium]MDE2499841.1 alpha/beta hydrolase [Alphaproteobacteria bacterium]